jgi:hypothetical protein
VREYNGQRVLAVFNLSDQAALLDGAEYRPMEGSGFEQCLGDDGLLRPFGVMFAQLAAVATSAPMAPA